jgi:hypothetical protein
MSLLEHQGGWVKREVEAARGTYEDADGDARAARGAGWGGGAVHGMATVSGVPATEEG